MNYQAMVQRIMQTVDASAYLTPVQQVDPRQREAVAAIERTLHAEAFDPERSRELARRLYAAGQIDRVMLLSVLHVIAASPRVRDWEEAARLVGEQEYAALEQGGPNLQANLASVDRHRGVLCFLRGHYESALDYFTRALERERSAENLGNILCTLLALGEVAEARALYDHMSGSLPKSLILELNHMIARDPDLALLRSGER